MIVQRANGVPWLLWIGRVAWRCEGCGAAGSLPDPEAVGPGAFARELGDLKRHHVECLGPDARRAMFAIHGVGMTLNPDRIEG